MIARFASGLRKDIQDIVELQEYSSLGSLIHLAMKVEAQLAKKNCGYLQRRTNGCPSSRLHSDAQVS